MEENYKAIVVGSGHAGSEACLALARKGIDTLLLTLNLDSIAFLACNPSIGGTAKGHLVCEIDALGGQMGINADKSTIQRRMLNSSKGVAVQSLRAQTDKVMYHTYMKETIENTPHLSVKQGEASKIDVVDSKVVGLYTKQGEYYPCEAIVVCTGVYLNSKIIIGDFEKNVGPNGFANATDLTKSLMDLGFEIKRFKTGTPVRVDGRTIDIGKLEVQYGEYDIQTFSFTTKKAPKNVAQCYLTYTTPTTHEIIRNNLHLAPMFNGSIKGVGPRYCPSIENKVVKFADKDRHQLFIEPEALSTNEMYLQGFSTSLPVSVQKEMVQSLPGLENAHIMRDAYAIEYDCIDATALYPTLESKKISGLYFAGQINGTSGYEEAGAQGIIAGINAGQKILGQEQIILARDEAYIGVLIDDLVTKGTDEPYRMMTSRAEYRLRLRQDNADLRLTDIGYKVGLIDEKRYKAFKKYKKELEVLDQYLSQTCSPNGKMGQLFNDFGETMPSTGISYKDALRRHTIKAKDLVAYFPELCKYSLRAIKQMEINLKYEGYLYREDLQIQQAKKQESIALPENINYEEISGLRLEAQEKLNKIRPLSLGQASRILGVSPADISVLTVYLKMKKLI